MAPSTSSSSDAAPKRRFGRTPKPEGAGRTSQMRQVYRMTKEQDPQITWILLLTFLGTVAVFLLVFTLLKLWWVGLVLGITVGLVLMVLVLGRRAQNAAYGMLRGRPGAAGAAVQNLGRGWNVAQEPVAVEAGGVSRGHQDMSKAAMVFRAVGRPGVVLVAEGPRSSAQRLLAQEKKRVARVAGEEVPVHVYRVGSDDQATDVAQLGKQVKRLPKQLTDAEVSAVAKRLDALGSLRHRLPGGIDPTRPPRASKRALRGR